MHDQVQRRLAELKSEFETGQARLLDLERQEAHLRETMLRISGAIQVLEELVSQESTDGDGKAGGADSAAGS